MKKIIKFFFDKFGFELKRINKSKLNFDDIYKKFFEDNITIFDVGANLGTTCITALKQKYAKYSIAIEAEKNLFKLLNLNIQLNNMSNNIVPLNFAASDKHEYFDLIKNNKNYGANFIKKKANNKNLKNKIQ